MEIENNTNIKNVSTSFFDRTLRKLKTGWLGIAGSAYNSDEASSRPSLPDGDMEKLRDQMKSCLVSQGGEVTARGRAAALGHVYLALNTTGRKRFLEMLAEDFLQKNL